MPDTGSPYFIPYAEPTDLVRDWPELSEDVALAIVAALENIPVTQKKIEAFTGDGTWTVPAGVTYAIAHMLGGGGGIGSTTTGGDGANSSVGFASGLVSSLGGKGGQINNYASVGIASAGANNTGQGASQDGNNEANRGSGRAATSSNYIVAGAAVTPAASIAVTVGAGGTAGTGGAAGGSGYVYIEYYEEV